MHALTHAEMRQTNRGNNMEQQVKKEISVVEYALWLIGVYVVIYTLPVYLLRMVVYLFS